MSYFLPQSSVVCGACATQRKDFAFTRAMQMFCKDSTGTPCGVCGSCVKISAGSHPDFFYINQDTPKVEHSREIRKNASVLPSQEEVKIFVIDNCDKMTVQAQNALLKLLEEPQSACFILLCHDERSLLQTIRSRCQIFRLSGEEQQVAHSPELEGLKTAFCQAFFKSPMELALVFNSAGSLSREDYEVFLSLCRQGIHSTLLSSLDNLSVTSRLTHAFDQVGVALSTLSINPNVYISAMSLCVKLSPYLST